MKLVANSQKLGRAMIPLRWCLVPEEITFLREQRSENPHLFLVIVNSKKEVDRQLIPIGKMMTYLSFRHPGENTVFASIVWRAGGFRNLKSRYLGKDRSGNYFILHYDSDENTLVGTDGYGLSTITVNVSPEFFSPEPKPWEKWWVNLWFETKPKDQCQFKKRRFLAYSIQPIAVLLFILFITVFRLLAALWWLGVRTRVPVNFGAIVHPFRNQSIDVWWEASEWRGGRDFYKMDKNKKLRPKFLLAFKPYLILLVAAILFLVDTLLVPEYDVPMLWEYLLLSVVTVAVWVIAAFLFGFILAIVGSIIEAVISSRDSKSKKRFKQQEKEAKAVKAEKLAAEAAQRAVEAKLKELENEFKLISCNGGPLIPKLEALPKEKRTIHLRFMDLKARVCKPFAG